MFKHVALLVRPEGTSHEEFVDRWQRDRVPAVRDAEGVVKYATVLPVTPAESEFDGLDERYFEDLDALRDALDAEAGRDGDDFATGDAPSHFVGEVVTQKDDTAARAGDDREDDTAARGTDREGGVGDTDGLYKHSAFLVRKEGMSHEAFVDHWQNRHTKIAKEIEGVVRYDTVLPVDPEESEFDGIAELYFEDLDALHDALGSEGSRDYDPAKGKAKEAREDVDNFLALEKRPRFIGKETVRKVRGTDGADDTAARGTDREDEAGIE